MKNENIIECSVIIPVFNVDKYLRKCMDSIIIQKQKNIEIICIDDASTDTSYDILCEYEKKDNRIQIYHLSSNRGLAYARNFACQYAHGRYLLFLDADDSLSEDALVYLLNIVYEKDYDMVSFGYKSVFENNDIQKQLSKRYPDRIVGFEGEWCGKELFCELYRSGGLALTAWAQMYRKSFLEENRIEFINGILHEDIPFTTKAFLCAEKVYYAEKVCYFWMHRANSITSSKVTYKHLEGRLIGIINILNFLKHSSFLQNQYEIIKDFINKLWFDAKNQYVEIEEKNNIFNDNYFYRLIYDITFTAKKQKKMKINCMEKIINSDEIIIYGAGKVAVQTIEYINTIGKKILGIAVTEKKDNEDYFYGHEVKSIQEFKDYKDALICIAVSKRYYYEVNNLLLLLGFHNLILVEYEFMD